MTTNRSAPRIIWLAALFACTCIAEAAATMPPRYHVTDLGTLGGTYNIALGINASGQVTGQSGGNAFLWTPTVPNGASGTMHDLKTLGGRSSAGYGINASGQVAGWSLTTGDAAGHAFLYTSGRGMVDLNSLIDPSSGWELVEAGAINDVGQITGFGFIGGDQHAFLLTPVPEPATLVLFALAMPILLFRYRLLNQAFPKIVGGLYIVSVVLLAGTRPTDAAIFSAANVPELIAAIDAANQNAEPDSIALAAGATFTLTDVNNATSGPTGLPTILAGGELTIFGNGAVIERSAAAETPAFRLFDVAAGASLGLQNLTLQGGYTSPYGGAILNTGALALTDVTIQNNAATGRTGYDCRCRTSPGGPGGPGRGGGIYSSGSVHLENSVLRNNQARGGRGGSGPGGLGRGGTGTGGGLYTAAGTATLLGSTVTGNVANGGNGSPFGSGYGGGIYIASAQVDVDEFTLAHVSGNTAATNYPNIFGPFDLIPNSNPLPGDFNHDGTVNAADYVVWRKNPAGIYTQNDFNNWRAHFGQTAGIGAAARANATVPEPATLVMLIVAAVGISLPRRQNA